MSWSAGMHIELCRPALLRGILDSLQEGGWGFHDGAVSFERDNRVETAPESAWLDVVAMLEAALREEVEVAVDFYWEGRWDAGDGIHITCTMSRPNELRILPDASAPRLDEAHPFVDWSWLHRRIVIPLTRNGFTIYSLDCAEGY